MAALIELRCAAPDHQQKGTETDGGVSPVTFADGKWAYCAAGVSDGHDWQEIAPASLDALRKRRAATEAALEGAGRDEDHR